MKGAVSGAERAERHGHRAALVMFVGKAGTGKHRYARALEKALFESGRNAYMLDGRTCSWAWTRICGSTPPRPSWCAGSARSRTC